MVGKAVRCKGSTNLAPRPPGPRHRSLMCCILGMLQPFRCRCAEGRPGASRSWQRNILAVLRVQTLWIDQGAVLGAAAAGYLVPPRAQARRTGEGAVQGKAAPGHLATPRFAAGYLTIDDWHSLAEEPGISLTNQRIQYATALL